MVEIKTRCRIPIWLSLGEFHGMSSQSHLPHCRVLPLGECTVVTPKPHATLQGAVTWRNHCHVRSTFQGVIIPSAILKIVFRHLLFYFCFFNAVWALTSGGFCIVSDTFVLLGYGDLTIFKMPVARHLEFLKFGIYVTEPLSSCYLASLRNISLKSDNWLLRLGYMAKE